MAAYSLWGAFPLYWPLLEPAGAVEILAHRVLWSAVTMTLAMVALRQTTAVVAVVRDRRAFRLLSFAAVVVSVNWARTSGASTTAGWSRRRWATSSTRWSPS